MSLITSGAIVVALGGCGKAEAPAPAGDSASTPVAAPAAAPGAQSAAGTTPLPGQNVNTGAPVEGDATVVVPDSVMAGAAFEAGWTGPGNSGDYIDIVPRGYSATSGEINYAYTRASIPTAKLRAPTTPGEYDVRYLLQLEGQRKVKATDSLTVVAATVRLTVQPSAEAGEPMSVTWEGPGGEGDYLDIVPVGHSATSGEVTYAYTRSGNPAQLTAPGKVGAYQVRYLLEGPGGRKVLAAVPLAVTRASATLNAPAVVAMGTRFKVEWTGPARRGDYVDLVPRGYAPTSGEKSYFYTTSGPAGELTAPAQAGDYEIRYVLEAPGGRHVLARRPVRVQ
jgi:Ca-activated chloride channel family protein